MKLDGGCEQLAKYDELSIVIFHGIATKLFRALRQ